LITVSAEDAGDEVHIAVADTGRGIAADDLPRVMEMFGQAGTDVVDQPGTGVGLPLVRRLVEAHGGRFLLTSDGIGTGTTAHIRLPKAGTPKAAHPSDATSEPTFDRRAQNGHRGPR
jgi:signal transduction histidine kinase